MCEFLLLLSHHLSETFIVHKAFGSLQASFKFTSLSNPCRLVRAFRVLTG